jgi:signal transduction histidine kinase
MVVLIGEEKCPAEPPIGAISVESPDYYAFDDTDLASFRALAALANDAIRNAREFLDRQYALDREANLKDLALYFIKCGILIHNQKAPVSAIKERAITLMETLAGEVDGLEARKTAEARKIAEGIISESENLEAISSQADPSAIQFVAVDLLELTRSWEDRLSMNPQLLNVSKSILGPEKSGSRIEIDELLMRHLLKVFIDNSIRAMQGKEEKFIRIIIGTDTESSCTIRICDSGKGISPQLWRIISAGKRPDSVVESRKGLRTALLIVTGFGGEIRLLNSSAAGTEFEIRLPLVN